MRFLFWTGEHFTRDADRFYFYVYGYNRLGYLFIEIFETATTTETNNNYSVRTNVCCCLDKFFFVCVYEKVTKHMIVISV